MVRLLLSIKADLENVTNLVPASDEYEYFFGVGLFPALFIHSSNVCAVYR